MQTDSKNAPFDDPRRSAPGRPRVTYVPREDATPEGELSTLAATYNYLLKCRERRLAADAGHGEEDAKVESPEEWPEECPASKKASDQYDYDA